MASPNPPAGDPVAESKSHPEPAAAAASHSRPQSTASQPAAGASSEKHGSTPPEAGRRSLEPALPVKTAEDKETRSAPRASTQTDDSDIVNPPDFQGEVLSNDELPSQETVRRIGDYIVLDRHGKTHTFKSLYTGRNVARRVLVIFVRHFYCGVSLDYMSFCLPPPPTAP